MCLKKIFDWFRPDPIPEPNPEPIEWSKRNLFTFGRNKYGGGSDLNGCVNDSHNLGKKLTSLFPDFVVRKFLDYDAKAKTYLAELEASGKRLGVGSTVLILADSCFSETSTRSRKKHPTKMRFFDPGLPRRLKKKGDRKSVV